MPFELMIPLLVRSGAPPKLSIFNFYRKYFVIKASLLIIVVFIIDKTN